MKIKTSELSGAALDWAVAKCEGLNPDESGLVEIGTFKGRAVSVPIFYAPSQNWAQGGPIIERERMTTEFLRWDEVDGALPVWLAAKPVRGFVYESEGNSPLIAAMRCYVASKLGDEVEIPQQLLQGEKHEG